MDRDKAGGVNTQTYEFACARSNVVRTSGCGEVVAFVVNCGAGDELLYLPASSSPPGISESLCKRGVSHSIFKGESGAERGVGAGKEAHLDASAVLRRDARRVS